MSRFPFRIATTAIGLACCLSLLSPFARAADIFDQYTFGTTSLVDPSMWGGGVTPGEGDRGLIIFTYEPGDYAWLDQAHTMQSLNLGHGFGDVGNLQIRNGGALTLLGAPSGAARVVSIGFEGEGSLELQSGASYELVDGDLRVGSQGGSTGSVTHAAGATLTSGGALILGTLPASSGTYSLQGGTLNVGGFLIVGRQGIGTFTQTAGDILITRGTPEAPAVDPGLYIGSHANATGSYTMSGGTLTIAENNGGFRIGVPTADNAATFRIEGSAPTITIATHFEHYPTANLQFAADASGVSTIDVAGNVFLAGNLNLSFPGTPTLGDEFTLINYGGSLAGTFAGMEQFTNIQGIPFVVSYGSGHDSAVVAAVVPGSFVLGDFDSSGTVTANDYDIFLANLNAGVLESGVWGNYLLGDMNFDSVVDYADGQLFRSAFDAMNGAGAFAAMIGSTQVPEPATWLLLGAVGIGVVARRRMRIVGGGLFALLLVLSVVSAPSARAQITYVDAVHDVNTFLLDGTSVPLDAMTTDDLWNFRSGLGIDGNAWESFYSENATPLKVTTPAVNTAFGYNIHAFFWSNASQNWRIEGTVNREDFNDNGTPDDVTDDFLPGEAPYSYNAKGAADGTLTGTVAIASDFTAAPILTEGDRTLYRGLIGTTFPAQDGTLTAYIDNFQTGAFTNGRNLFDGIGYEIAAVNLTLTVDPTTGAASIVNQSGMSLAIDYYEIRSASGALDDTNWHSLDEQLVGAIDGGDAGNIPGDSSTERWGKAGGSLGNPHMLSEFYLPGYMTVANGATLDLGTPFDFSSATTDGITFTVGVEGYGLLTAVVALLPGAELNADFNGDGIVDAADYLVWRNHLGSTGAGVLGDANGDGTVNSQDYLVWKSQYGTNPNLGAAVATATTTVPEPASSTLALVMFVLALLTRWRLVQLQPVRA